jgi:hypothetical protein
MKKTVTINIRSTTPESVEVEFPIYRDHDCGGDDFSAHIYTRIDADGTHYSVHTNDADEYEISISQREIGGGDRDYILGLGMYACSAEQFARVLAKAKKLLDRFPTT